MNRNNFLIHLALAIVLILIAAFAGQLNRWRKEWRTHVHVIPAAEKKRASTAEEIALAEGRHGRAEVLVKFKSNVSLEAIDETVPAYEGTFVLAADVVISPAAKTGDTVIRGSLNYQTCDDKVCYLPVTIPLDWTVKIAPATTRHK